ncbi:hypothetical protein RLOC_00007428 [Lonchura striata]|uniref:Uncharacterized protein n=1 Tax=Lonchura striata TaxID=40157 RepID=A0A218UT69_9PASE|nr:hypothetical protein RLOC_00007428 [Lonchura striata domestica]
MPPGRRSGALALPAPPAALLEMVRGIMDLLRGPAEAEDKALPLPLHGQGSRPDSGRQRAPGCYWTLITSASPSLTLMFNLFGFSRSRCRGGPWCCFHWPPALSERTPCSLRDVPAL